MKHITRNTNRSHRYSARDRRAARVRISLVLACTLGVLLAWAGVWHEVLPWKSASDGVALAIPAINYGSCFPAATPGYARRYETQINVSTYSAANAVTRNLMTVIPLVSWSGVGPDVSLSLYHNSGAIDSPLDLVGPGNLPLGPGWSLSYGSHIEHSFVTGTTTPTTVVIHDDGRQDAYTSDGTSWVAPVGVHDVLTGGGGSVNNYVLTHKDQSFHEYSFDDGRLIAIGDGLGNEIVLSYGVSPARLNWITDASGRQILFGSDSPNSPFNRILDPMESNETTIEDRLWAFSLDSLNRLSKIVDPMGFEIDITYDGSGRIATITDKHEAAAQNPPTYTYTYHTNWDENAIETVTDPRGMTQSFNTFCDDLVLVEMTYTDRRGSDWKYTSIREAPSFGQPNGPLRHIDNPFLQRTTFNYDSDRNMTEYVNALNNTWSYTYDNRGNVLSVESPVHIPTAWNRQEWTYDAYNNVTSYSPTLLVTTTFHYDIAGYPTLLSSIVEPPDGQGSGTATTALEYFLSNPPNTDLATKNGKLKQVTDPNGVVTALDYDQWGHVDAYREGLVGSSYIYNLTSVTDSGSRTISTQEFGPASVLASGGGTGGASTYYPNNKVKSTFCVAVRLAAQESPTESNEATSSKLPIAPTGPISPFPAVSSCSPVMPDDMTSQTPDGDHTTYYPTGEPKHVAMLIATEEGSSTRSLDWEYDALGFLTKARTQDTLSSPDWTASSISKTW